MAESFEEIVQFVWNVQDVTTSAKSMTDALDSIDKKLSAVAGTSTQAFQTVANAMNPALSQANLLIEKYTEILRLQALMGNVAPPIKSTVEQAVREARVPVGMGLYQYPNDAPDQYRNRYGRFESMPEMPGQGMGGFNRSLNSGQSTYRFGQEDWAAQGYFQSQSLVPQPPPIHFPQFPENLPPQDYPGQTPRQISSPDDIARQIERGNQISSEGIQKSLRDWQAILDSQKQIVSGASSPNALQALVPTNPRWQHPPPQIGERYSDWSQFDIDNPDRAWFGRTPSPLGSRDSDWTQFNRDNPDSPIGLRGRFDDTAESLAGMSRAALEFIPGAKGTSEALALISQDTASLGESARQISYFKEILSQQLNLPTGEIQAAFQSMDEAAQKIIALGTASQALAISAGSSAITLAGASAAVIPSQTAVPQLLSGLPNVAGYLNPPPSSGNVPYGFSWPWNTPGAGGGASTATIDGSWTGGRGMPPGGGGIGQGPPFPPGPIGANQWGGMTPGGPQGAGAIQQQANAVQNLGQQFNTAEGHASQFERTLGRIVLYSAIFAGFAVVSTVIRGVVDEMLRLEDVSSRVGFITGASEGQVQAQFTQAAKYGISPEQAGPGILAAAQLGMSNEDQEIARRLAVVAGPENYAEILDEVNELQSRANNLGIENLNILDFMAESWRTVQGSVTDYSDALNIGMQTGAALGLQAEQAGLAAERVVRTSGASITFVGNLAQSTIDRLQDPKIQKDLQDRFGITPTEDTAQMVLQIADLQAKLGAAGNQKGIQDISGAIQGGLAGPQRTRELPLLFQEWAFAIREGNQELSKFEDLESRVLDDGVRKINQMTAAWRLFLMSVGDTSAFKEVIEAITGALNAITNRNQFWTAWEDRTPEDKQALLSQYTKETGLETGIRKPGIEFSNDLNDPALRITTKETPFVVPPEGATQAERQAMNDALLVWALTWINDLPTASSEDAAAVNRRSTSSYSRLTEDTDTVFGRTAPRFEFGGFNTLSKDAGYTGDQLQAKANEFDKLIAASGYEVEKVNQAYYDETTGLFRNILASTAATAYATEALRKMQQEQITGTFNVPDGGRSVAVLFNALTAGFKPDYGNGVGGTGPVYVTDTPEQRQRDNVLVSTLETLDASTRGVLGYLQAHGANVDPDDPYGGRKVGTRGAAGQDDPRYNQGPRYNPPTYNPTQEPFRTPLSERHIDRDRMTQHERPEHLYPGSSPFPDLDYERGREKPLLQRPGGRQIGSRETTSRPVSNAININNRIQVTIDGRLLASYMNRKTYREFENIRGSNSNGPNTGGMVG